MRIWHQYPEFFRRVPSTALDALTWSPWRGRNARTLRRAGHLVREQPPDVRSSNDALPSVNPRKPVLELPLAVRRRLGLTSGDSRARLTRARAKQSGRDFEMEIELANECYERRGLATVYRHHPAVEGWGRTLRVVGKGPADFSGVVRLTTGAAIAVAFDCKVVSGSASYRHAPRDRHQLESLVRFRDTGGRAFLLLCCRVLDRVWLLDDLDTLLHGDRIEIRRRTDDGFTHLLPVLAPSSDLDVARGARPHWDYRQLIEGSRGA
ncbi:MAG: hypothetical protein ACJ79K_09755 [Gemmatimonadaceae bacterium]